jgi:hypothetical protein
MEGAEHVAGGAVGALDAPEDAVGERHGVGQRRPRSRHADEDEEEGKEAMHEHNGSVGSGQEAVRQLSARALRSGEGGRPT